MKDDENLEYGKFVNQEIQTFKAKKEATWQRTTVYVKRAFQNNFDGLGTLSEPHNSTIIVKGKT